MGQTKLESLIEVLINTIIGFIVSFLVWPIAAYITSVEYNSTQHVAIIIIFTIASVARGYIVRRYFNQRLQSASKFMAERISKKT